ncbi:uncharacterized protein At4g04775-like [Vicia villosa]|uniref:uncharacterized protein At4g04775-like n=1 Tax=Vicia villosa TaxID=3911 RepID=UPI00273C08D9|nr:uncharacterized protein At4g04775-like [Vicia villosa]
MSETNFSFASSNLSGARRRGGRCWCGLESPLMTSWTYENPGRRFNGCGNYKVMKKKQCNYFQWYDEDMSGRAKDVIRSLKDRNDELVDLFRDTKNREEFLQMKIKFMSYFVGFCMVFVILGVFVLVATYVVK